jgi:hypothetical protein
VLEVVREDNIACWSTPEAIWVVWCIPFKVICGLADFITDPGLWVVIEFFTFVTEEALEIAVLSCFIAVVNGSNTKVVTPFSFSGFSVSENDELVFKEWIPSWDISLKDVSGNPGGIPEVFSPTSPIGVDSVFPDIISSIIKWCFPCNVIVIKRLSITNS